MVKRTSNPDVAQDKLSMAVHTIITLQGYLYISSSKDMASFLSFLCRTWKKPRSQHSGATAVPTQIVSLKFKYHGWLCYHPPHGNIDLPGRASRWLLCYRKVGSLHTPETSSPSPRMDYPCEFYTPRGGIENELPVPQLILEGYRERCYDFSIAFGVPRHEHVGYPMRLCSSAGHVIPNMLHQLRPVVISNCWRRSGAIPACYAHCYTTDNNYYARFYAADRIDSAITRWCM